MTEPELTTVVHALVRLKFETKDAVRFMASMGPTWTAQLFTRVTAFVAARNEPPTITDIWGEPGSPNLWRLKP